MAWAADKIEKDRKTIARYQRVSSLNAFLIQKSILCFMMAVSSLARGNFDVAGTRPNKLAAPLYFDFGWQVYNSVSHYVMFLT